MTRRRAAARAQAVFEAGVPVLGICYGMQTMAAQLGGRVEPGAVREFGYAEVRARGHSALLRDIEDRVNAEGHGLLDVWMSHGDRVVELPPGFKVSASTPTRRSPAWPTRRAASTHCSSTPRSRIPGRARASTSASCTSICGCEARWNAGNIIEDAIARVRAQVGGDKVLLGLSGGVDSSVVAALLHRAIGDQLICVFVDHGLLRHDEGDQVMAVFARNLGVRVIRVDAAERFFAALAGVADPEPSARSSAGCSSRSSTRRRTSSRASSWLAQGTIYPDVIESAGAKTGKAHVIKSHHNVGGLPETMKLRLVEPLRELFKDEVRRIGVELGLPARWSIVTRSPGRGSACASSAR